MFKNLSRLFVLDCTYYSKLSCFLEFCGNKTTSIMKRISWMVFMILQDNMWVLQKMDGFRII